MEAQRARQRNVQTDRRGLGRGVQLVEARRAGAEDGRSLLLRQFVHRKLHGKAAAHGGSLRLRERTVTGIPGLDKLVAAFDPADLPAGDYTLTVAVTDPATRLQPANSIPIKVLN